MSTVDSLLSSISLTSTDTSPSGVNHEPMITIKQEYCEDMMSVSYDIIPADDSNTNIDDTQETIDHQTCTSRSYTVVAYGPINVKVKLHESPTLKTGRRSKFIPLEGDAAKKREIQREKNRQLARRLKEQRGDIERRLVDEINQLESLEKNLTDEVRNLESYKHFLENRYQEKVQERLIKEEQYY